MTANRRFFPLMSLSLGGIGVVVCVAGVLGVWRLDARLDRAAENLFARIDRSFVAVRDRVDGAGQRIRAAKISSEEIEQRLNDWTKKEAGERLTSRLGVEEKAEQLASGLQHADDWLEFSESSIQLIRQAMELGNSAGALFGTDSVDQLLEELASLRSQLTEATESVERIRARTAEAGKEKTIEERIDQAVHLALRVIATLSSIDSRVGDFGNRISATQADARDLKAKTLRRLQIATIVVTLLILWMAAGQISLCLHGWRSLRQTRTGRPSGQ